MMEKLAPMATMLEMKKARIHGLKAEMDASAHINTNFGMAEKIYGTPKLEAWGPSFFGWAN